jgi:predicted nucleic acid-binding protein
MRFPTAIPTGAPPALVLDVSLGAAWAIPARYTVYAHRVQSRLAFGAGVVVPTNWPLDVLDEWLAAVGRGETTRRRTDTVLANLALYPITLDPDAPYRASPEVLYLARTHDLSATVAASLELALRLNLPLATAGAALVRAAGAAGVSIFAP